jgi:Transcriptional regulators containing a DNA-binding HTH domain and an aminotransferase domain (MocR family) and their eukaryotic orthologs
MLWLPIDKTSEIPLIKQVYQQIRSLILDGELKAGEKLPATRELAAHINVSRNVIIEAYELLIAEGYIVSSPGSGTYIAEGVFLEGTRPETRPQTGLSCHCEPKSGKIDFRSGIPDLQLLPRKKWSQLEHQICLDSPAGIFGYDFPEGRLELRTALCRYLKKSRGVNCGPEQIIVTCGAVQALFILTKALLTPESSYIIEDPIHREIRHLFEVGSNCIFPVPLDESGIRTDLLPQNIKPALIMLTPSHQYPLGVILPAQRRIELIQYARVNGCYIIEDDYDSEFRYQGPPISSLQGLDPDRVVYIGSFSKILFPALRLGYMILPPVLVERCRDLKHLQDNHAPILAQLTLARFIEGGYLERHIAKMKKIYRAKRDFLIASLKKAFPAGLKISGESTGLHLIAEFRGIIFDDQTMQKIKETGMVIHPVNEHALEKKEHSNKIILGYSHLSHQEIAAGVAQLKAALDQLADDYS